MTNNDYYEERMAFYKQYANPNCQRCNGFGFVEIWDSEPWGDTFIDVPKGVCECECTRLKGVQFQYWQPYTRKYLGDWGDIPF